MSDSKEMGKQQLGPLGHLGLGHVPLALQVFFLIVFSVLLLVIVVKVFKIPSSPGQEQSSQEKVYQELTQLKAGVDRLCRPCPWDWTLFQENCYFFSVAQKTWNDSATACQNVGAQLVVIKSDEEQKFLQKTSKKRGYTWMGLIDLHKESTWHWVDGSPLTLSFMKYWNEGEPNNLGEEDCAEFRGEGWNDTKCDNQKFWICKKPKTSCPGE